MNSINPIAASSAAYKAQTVSAGKPTGDASAAAAGPARGSDTVEISGIQTFMTVLKANDVRADKVADVRAQIAAGTYVTDEKLDIAIDRLLDDLS
jgi:negative regulator of flagellin synthesis FlgM